MQKLPHQIANKIIVGDYEEFDESLLLIEVVGLIKTRGYRDDKISATSVLKALTANISKKTLKWLLEELFILFMDDRSSLSYICDAMFSFGFYGGEGIRGAPAEIKSEIEKEGRCFPYIPYDQKEFLWAMNKISPSYLRKQHDFIDVGSGIGDKVLLAQLLGFKTATGVEINNHTSQLAKHFLNVRHDEETNIRLINKDAFDLDFSEFNFIYMYRPIQDEKLLAKLHKKVLDEMPADGRFVDVGCSIKNILEKYSGEESTEGFDRSSLYIIKNKNDGKPRLDKYYSE